MIAIVGTDPSLLDAVRYAASRLGDEHELLALADIEEGRSAMRAAVLCFPTLAAADAERIAALRARHPVLPIFLVTHFNPVAVDAAYRAYKLHEQISVVWTDDLSSLAETMAAQLTKRPLELLFEALRGRRSVSRLTRDALAMICVSSPVVRTVSGLAGKLRTDPVTLRRHWKTELSRATGPREMIEWRILLAWIDLAPTTTLDEAAFVLRVTARRIERIARRRVGMTATKAAANGNQVRARLAEWAAESFGVTA